MPQQHHDANAYREDAEVDALNQGKKSLSPNLS